MITPAACQMLAELCRARAGIRISADKVYLIETRLGPVARLEGYTSTQAFIERLDPDPRTWRRVGRTAAQPDRKSVV